MVGRMAVLGGCLLGGACGLIGSSGSSGGGEEPVAEGATPPEASVRVVGEVASVHQERGFVLIRRFGGGGLPDGYVYHAQSPTGATASLSPTGERLGRYYAADIRGGEPRMGDLVVMRRLPSGAVAPSVPVVNPLKTGAEFP